MCDRVGLFGKNPHQAKMTKKWSKMAQKHGFWTFKENYVISFVWNLCKMKVLMVHQHSAKTACLGKIWFSSYSQKWLSANEISVFFNRKYFTNRLISDFHFWHVDKHEWKKQSWSTHYLKKILNWGNSPFWAQKLHILINSGSAGRIFLKFCPMKGANR